MKATDYYENLFEPHLNQILGDQAGIGARIWAASFGPVLARGPAGQVQSRFLALAPEDKVRFCLCLHFSVLLDQAVQAAAPKPVWTAFDQRARVPKLSAEGAGRRDPHASVLLAPAATWAGDVGPSAEVDVNALTDHFADRFRRFALVGLDEFLVAGLPAVDRRRIAEKILCEMESSYPSAPSVSQGGGAAVAGRGPPLAKSIQWMAAVRERLSVLRLPPVASLGDLPFVAARHLYLASLEDHLNGNRELQSSGIEVLAEALRDVVRSVEGDIDSREALAWINHALDTPIKVTADQRKLALHHAHGRRWLSWSGGLIRSAAFSDRTALIGGTRALPPTGPSTTSTPASGRGIRSGSGVQTPGQQPPRGRGETSQAQGALFPTPPPAGTASPPPVRVQTTRLEPAPSTRPLPTWTIADPAIVPGSVAGAQFEPGSELMGVRRWRILRLVGHGGMGRVWEGAAADPPATRVAIKTVAAPTVTNRTALEGELRLLRALRRADYFPMIHDAVTTEGQLHLVMDWVPGRTLHDWTVEPESPKVDVDRFFLWMEQVADRLAFLHAWPGRPILFRDLKPSNVMYDEESARVRLVDFGIGHFVSPDGEGHVRAGTEGFMAPEVRSGRVDVRTDIYAFGRLGLFLIFGSYDFGRLRADSRPIDAASRRISVGLVRACMQLCDADSAARPSTVMAALARLREGASGQQRPLPATDPCPVCGGPRPKDTRFCPTCGAARGVTGRPEDRASVAFAHEVPRSLTGGDHAARAARAYEELLAIRAAADLNSLRSLGHIDVEPYDYQREAAAKVIGEMGGRAMIADDVGLGKTIEAGLILKEYLIRGLARRTLLVAPPGLLLTQLCEELRAKFLIPIREYSAGGDRMNPQFSVGPEGLGRADHVAVSLRTLARDETIARFEQESWDVVVVDECHHIKSEATKAYRAVRRLVARYTLFMSATPFSGRHEELWAVYTALRPGILGDKRSFLRAVGPGGIAEQHRRAITGMTIRRRRADILVRFPGRQARRLKVEMDDVERQRYLAVAEAVRADGMTSLTAIQPLLEVAVSYEALRKSSSFQRFPAKLRDDLNGLTDADHPKVRAFLTRFVDRLPRGEKALVFTHFRESQRAILRLLHDRGRGARGLLDLNARQRAEAVEWFRDSPDAEFMVCGKGAGEGLNLQFCGLLVNLDLPWNPMQIEQRIGRVQRLGQRRTRVAVVNAVLHDTIEDRVLEIMEHKLRMFQGMLGDTEQIVGEMFSGEGETFESWIAASILPDGTMRPAQQSDLAKRLVRAWTAIEGGKAAADVVNMTLGLDSATSHPRSNPPHGPAGPNQPPVSIDFLGDL